MELESSLPCLQEPATDTYPEPDKSTPSTYFRYILILSSYLRLFSSQSFSFRCTNKTPVWFLFFFIRKYRIIKKARNISRLNYKTNVRVFLTTDSVCRLACGLIINMWKCCLFFFWDSVCSRRREKTQCRLWSNSSSSNKPNSATNKQGQKKRTKTYLGLYCRLEIVSFSLQPLSCVGFSRFLSQRLDN
jgi:hypothetical protein